MDRLNMAYLGALVWDGKGDAKRKSIDRSGQRDFPDDRPHVHEAVAVRQRSPPL